MNEFEVLSSHFIRKCHPETCCCSTEWVVAQLMNINSNNPNDRYWKLYEVVGSYQEGIEICKELNKKP
jgi:hypothetical protein